VNLVQAILRMLDIVASSLEEETLNKETNVANNSPENLAYALWGAGYRSVKTVDQEGRNPRVSTFRPSFWESAQLPGVEGLQAFCLLLGADFRSTGSKPIDFEGLTAEASLALSEFADSGPIDKYGKRNPVLSAERLGMVGSFMQTAVENGWFSNTLHWTPGRPFTRLEVETFSAVVLHGGDKDPWFNQFAKEPESQPVIRHGTVRELVSRPTGRHSKGIIGRLWRYNPAVAIRNDSQVAGTPGEPLSRQQRSEFYSIGKESLIKASNTGQADNEPFDKNEGVLVYWEDFLLVADSLIEQLKEE